MHKSFYETALRGALFDMFKVQVKAHYRQLPNGHIVRIDAYYDKRKAARKDPDKFKGKVIHADANGTTYMNHKGEEIHYLHGPHRELTKDDIHAHLNGSLPIDEDLAHDISMKHLGINNFHEHLKSMVSESKKNDSGDTVSADERLILKIAQVYSQLSPENLHQDGERPRHQVGPLRRRLEKQLADLFDKLGKKIDESTAYKMAADIEKQGKKGSPLNSDGGDGEKLNNIADASKHFAKTYTRPLLKQLRKVHGDSTTLAEAYTDKTDSTIKNYMDHQAADPNANHTTSAMAHMAQTNAQKAVDELAEEHLAMKGVDHMTPQDCPPIDGIDKNIKFFGHQAEVLAKMSQLKRAIVDVDMGGGKGLLLPADALHMMATGKVKRPLIVAPQATVDQNASKLVNEYSNGQVNVFKITNAVIRDVYDGDVDAMVADMQKAPPNTVFMASYDVFAHQTIDPDTKKPMEGETKFQRGMAISSGGKFDMVSLDESHNIKNADTSRWKAMQFLSKAKYKRCASGTFVSNNPGDVLGQLKWLHPQLKMSDAQFKEKYGYSQTKEGVKWDSDKLKDLRDDLKSKGLISVRRSAWMHNLPQRNEQVSIVKADKVLADVNDIAINDFLNQVEEEMLANPKLKKAMADGEVDGEFESSPNLSGGMNLIGGVTDYPDILAELVDNAYRAARGYEQKGEDGNTSFDDEEAAKEYLAKFHPNTRKALKALKGMVSPKAKDCYAKIKEHMADKKNGKYIVFCQRKFSAEHIMRHMPEDMKKHAMYFDASKMDQLPDFSKNPDGPKILIAVDASIKEGMNMQIANGMYRYDHHFSPGSQEQSYARVWRFGQDKPVNIHNGVVDGGLDVTKYCRMMTKHHENMVLTSEMPKAEDQVDEHGEKIDYRAYKLSIDNIRNHRVANLEVPQYEAMGKRIIDFQKAENIPLRKRYGDKGIAKATGKPIGGKGAKIMHGIGAYHTEFTGDEKKGKTTDEDKDALAGHFRDALRTHHGEPEAYDQEHWDVFFPEAVELAGRMKLKGLQGKKMDDATWSSYKGQYEHETGEKLLPKEEKTLRSTVDAWSSGKKHTPHKTIDHGALMKKQIQTHELPFHKEAHAGATATLKQALAWAKTKKKHIKLKFGPATGKYGAADNPEDLDGFWKEFEKKNGKASATLRKLVNGGVAVAHHHEGGWDTVQSHHEEQLKE